MSQPLSEPLPRKLPNRTRRSESIPRRLAAEGKFHLLPVYALLTTSDLAREGIRNSGSFRFADHIYRNEPSGRYGVGRVLDGVLLKLRGARSMRSRFFHSRREILRAVNEMRGASTGVRDGATVDDQLEVVSVPCGIARDLYDVAETLWTESALYEQVRFIGIDLDQEALDLSWNLTHDHFDFEFRCADALAAGSLPKNVDVIVSLGFGEFLSDDVLRDFYRSCHASLNDGGRFITSAMSRDRISDYLARELAELHTHYRSTEQLTDLLESAGFATIRTTRDEVGLQTLAVAEKAL
jgi:2-polyprenyl-3-methyl-5-hydroxy-6-metoxy-1,4-benzoquinol methylase